MSGFYLSDRAAQSLDNIGDYSREAYGPERARAYVRSLLDRCRALAAGAVPHQSCRIHFAEELREDLRFIRAGRHFVIFMDASPIRIVDFIHQSADVGGRLGGTDA